MSATLPDNEKALINDAACNEGKDFSFADANQALQSSPMIGEVFLDLIRTAPDAERWLWRSIAWLILRIADRALERGELDARRVARARRALKMFTHLKGRGLLQSLLDAATGREYVRDQWRATVAQRVNDFAEFLRDNAHFAAAAEVYGMTCDTLDIPDRIRIEAFQGRAWVLRELGQHDNADLIYDQMLIVAEEAGKTHMALEAELGHARMEIKRGAIRKAEAMVWNVIDRATPLNFARVIGRAYIDLAYIASTRKRYDKVIKHTEQAMLSPIGRTDRDLCGLNMAEAYRLLHRSAAATAYAEDVLATAQGLDERICATIILYHLAMDQGNPTIELRERLQDEDRMSALRRAELYEANARDAYLSDDRIASFSGLAEGLVFAEAHKLNEMVMYFDESLAHLEREKVPPRFLAPNNLIPPASALALRRIEDNARRAKAASDDWNELRAGATAGSHEPRLLVETFVNRVVAAGG